MEDKKKYFQFPDSYYKQAPLNERPRQSLPLPPEDLFGVETECFLEDLPNVDPEIWKRKPMCIIHVEDPISDLIARSKD